MQHPQFIYKVATEAIFAPSRISGEFVGMPVDLADGYMHFSTADQLAETLRRHFAGQSDLVLMAIRRDALDAHLRWEPSRGGALFPHLYDCPLPLSAVEWEAPLSVAADGTSSLPEAVR
jgi:uncharacterized protein (DUF952 family)